MEKQKLIVLEDFSVSGVFSKDARPMGLLPSNLYHYPIPLKKEWVLVVVGGSRGGPGQHDTYKVLFSLSGGRDFPKDSIMLDPSAMNRDTPVKDIDLPELDVPYDCLPVLLGQGYVNQKIIKWRLEKGV